MVLEVSRQWDKVYFVGEKLMKIWGNGIIREMTAEEIAAMQDAAARAEAEEKHRPLTIGEVQEMLVRSQINTLAVDDATAYRMREFYPVWGTDKQYKTGEKFTHGGNLYKVLQDHTSQETWTPDITASLYARIDETHDGTKYDPIPYDGNMALVSGKYYSQSGVVYLCDRDTVNPVYNTLADLVGIYVTVVEV